MFGKPYLMVATTRRPYCTSGRGATDAFRDSSQSERVSYDIEHESTMILRLLYRIKVTPSGF